MAHKLVQKFNSKEWTEFTKILFSWCQPRQDAPEASFKSDLELYLNLLLERNKQVNLTSISGWDEALWKHLLDSLALVSFSDLGSVLDWGTGGGLPGIPLLLWRKHMLRSADQVQFVDSIGKKIISVRYFLDQLSFSSSLAHIGRGETLLSRLSIDSVVMRAVAPPERAIPWMGGGHAKNWFIFCGPSNRERWIGVEAEMRKKSLILSGEHQYDLPNGLGSRTILRFSVKK